jgi:osmotically-inducible protein OsmY
MREEAFVPLVENNVQARVENGVVTLTGTVPTVRERDELVTLIAKIPGVVQVRDRTTID